MPSPPPLPSPQSRPTQLLDQWQENRVSTKPRDRETAAIVSIRMSQDLSERHHPITAVVLLSLLRRCGAQFAVVRGEAGVDKMEEDKRRSGLV
ncbi:hypothetical protein RchiOBHm_Chr5g0037091 [Rosa chinensis]|uniref:Uncharacterized protein n=1 Tax=Rosa chinensis TaxID=74649 RepID=A0A2P6QBN4_ROSCH|nr:hypothetical protein RchiOBHm_Chr5g0037091 [Rosa chinensis]